MIKKVIDGAYEDMANRLTDCHAKLMEARIGLERAASTLEPLEGYRDCRDEIILAGHSLRELESELAERVALIRKG